jgi:hypothetical protein
MSTNNFIKFYTEYLSKHQDIKSKIEAAGTNKEFGALVMAEGKKAGFEFSEDDVEKVLISSLSQRAKKGELSEGQLEGVVGGAAAIGGTIQVASIKSLTSLSSTHMSGTVMCPSLF